MIAVLRSSFAGLILAVSLGAAAAQPQTGTGMAQPNPLGAGVVPSITSRAASASAAARGARALTSWLNEKGLKHVIQKSLEEADKRITTLLLTSGQPGVLYYVEIQQASNETRFRSLVGDSIRFVGAGTSAEDVAIAVSQISTLNPTPRAGYVVIQDESFYFWFERDGKQLKVSTYSAIGIRNRVLRELNNSAFITAYNGQSTQRALQAAVAWFETSSVSAQTKQRMAKLEKQLAEQDAQVTQIQLRLEEELERARKADSVARTLSLLSNVLTLSQQVAEFRAVFGAETPMSVNTAKSPSDLQGIVNEIANNARKRGNEIQIQLDQWQDRASGTRRERLQILETNRYPLGDVPQLRLP